jgi:hypothetical protein
MVSGVGSMSLNLKFEGHSPRFEGLFDRLFEGHDFLRDFLRDSFCRI